MQRAGRVARGERRAFLDGELIEREMVGFMAEREPELVVPRGRRLTLARIDQVERHAREMPLGESKCGKRLVGGVLAAERLQARIVQRLHPERQAVDAGCAVAREVLSLD